MMRASLEALRAFLDEIVIDPLWVHEALRSPVLGMNVEIERNVDIAVNGIRGVVDSLTAPFWPDPLPRHDWRPRTFSLPAEPDRRSGHTVPSRHQ